MKDKNTNYRNWSDIKVKTCKTERTTLPTNIIVERTVSNDVENIFVIGAEIVSAKPNKKSPVKLDS